MEKLDIQYICTVIGNLSGVPIRILEDGETVFFHSIARLPLDPMCLSTAASVISSRRI